VIEPFSVTRRFFAAAIPKHLPMPKYLPIPVGINGK